jgi:protein-S-isoprenylcysteine O-methyltransferase Ste14
MRVPATAAALATALVLHPTFLFAVGSLAYGLATGMQHGRGTLPGAYAVAGDVLLVAQFPLLHSWLLTPAGRGLLARCSPFGHGPTLAVSGYALVASLQILLTCWGWTPSGVVWHEPHGATGVLQWGAFGGAWLFLKKALWDAGPMLQSGAAGWWALLRGRAVDYGDLPTGGLFARCRQPIYLGFALVLWTAPVWSLDWLALAAGWSTYCVVGPLRKEARWQRRFGARFAAYRATVPYLLPRMRR